KEVFPNALAPLIVQATIMIPLAIIAEASLSFLGLGVKPTTPTWGLLVGQGRQFISQAWWISVIPGLALSRFELIRILSEQGAEVSRTGGVNQSVRTDRRNEELH